MKDGGILGRIIILIVALVLLLCVAGGVVFWTPIQKGLAQGAQLTLGTNQGPLQTAAPTKVPSNGTGFQFVERPVPAATPNVTGKIDWNEQLVILDWRQLPGLYPGVQLYYNQSAVGKDQTITNIEVKAGSELIFGAVSVDITVKDTQSGATSHLVRSGGVYGAIPAGQIVTSMTITDGFLAMGAKDDAQKEFCARIAQAVAEKWALSTTFPDPTWSQPICEGSYAVPVDSDRIHGGSIPAK